MYLTKLAGDTLSNSNSKSRDTLWRKLSHLSGKRNLTALPVDVSADDFNAHFLTIAQRTIEDIPPVKTLLLTCAIWMFLLSCDEQEVLDIMTTLDTTKAAGPDKISPLLIKKLSSFIVELVTGIINKNFRGGNFPQAWKQARVIRIKVIIRSLTIVLS